MTHHESTHFWGKHHYQVVPTQDGSPSLRSLNTENQEIMHHSGGAWSETWYIYGRPLQKVFQEMDSPSVASVGLGLGYNELLSAKISLLSDNKNFQLSSFEKDPFLAESFVNFILDQKMNPEIHNVYESVLKFVAEKTSSHQIKEKLKSMYHNNSWQVLGALDSSILEPLKSKTRFNAILYDAFSSKTSPELWSEDFLSKFISMTAAQNCMVSTYACTGSLKRALKANEFHYVERLGFMGKRNSSLGVRGFNSNPNEWIEIS